MTDGAALSTLAGKLAYQTAVSWSPDGKLVLSGANDGAVRVWQAGSGQVAAELPAGVDGEVIRTGAFSGDGRWLAAAGEKGNLYLWPWPVGNKAAPLAQQIIGSQPILALAFSPKISSNNWRLATAGQDGRLRLWNWDGKILKPVASSDTPLRSIRALAFSPDGQAIATGSDDGKIRLWDSATLQLRRAWAAQNAYIKTLAFEGSGTGLASAGGDGSVRVWAVATGQPLAAVQFQTPVEALAFAADGLALAASTQDGAIHLWRPADGRSYLTIEGQGLAALGLAFAPGCHDRLAATTQDGALQIWDLDLQAPGAPEATPPALPAPLASVKAAQFVRIENGHLSLNGQPVKLKGFNFYPHLAPWNAMWQHWDGPQVAADLDKVRDLGANTLRVLVPYGANYEWTQADGTPQPQMLDELEQMIGLAADRNMRVLLTLFDFYGDFPLAGTADEAANWRYLETLAARYRDDPRVLGWDLHNEPDNYTLWQQDNQAQVLSWLARAAQHLRQTDPNHFITIGLGNWQNLSQAGPDGVNALAQEDLVALHDYDATSLDRQIDEVQASGGATLPVVLEEFGWPSAPSELTADYSETTQAGRYRQSLDTIARRNLDGGLAWSLWDFTPNSVLNLKPDIAQQFFGLVRLDGSFKPAAQVWQAAYPATDFALAAEARPATPGLNVRPVDPNLYPLFFPATGFAAPTPFKEYWNRMGGLDSFGYPIGGVRLENGYLVQYFERARFEYHPEGENTPGYASLPKSEQLKHIVLLGLLGREWLGQKGRNFPPAAPLASADQTYFSETAHNLGGRFKLYWQKHGGLARFGFPLSEEIEEVSATDGKRYLVQYFERARFEYHPEAAGTPYEVELGQLGRELS
jgi:WD40 repeat protein